MMSYIQNKSLAQKKINHNHLALMALTLVSAMTVPASAFAATEVIYFVDIPAGNGQSATQARCSAITGIPTFSNTYFTVVGGRMECNIPAGKPGAGSKLTVGITNTSRMRRDTTGYDAVITQEYRISSSEINYVLQGNPPDCVAGTTYSYISIFQGIITIDSDRNNQIVTKRFSVFGDPARYRAATKACSP